jgi:hypothetical protein
VRVGQVDVLRAAPARVVDLAAEGHAVRARHVVQGKEPQVEAKLPRVGLLRGGALFGLVEDARIEPGPVDLAHQRGAVGRLGGQLDFLALPLVAVRVDVAPQRDGGRLLLHPEPVHGQPRLAGTEDVVADQHAADAKRGAGRGGGLGVG